MTREYVYNVWAPPGGPWSPWAKPVLFAHVDPLRDLGTLSLFVPTASPWLPAHDRSVALVLDLPGAMGVAIGMHAARAGYRPVPLYNALPSSSGPPLFQAKPVCEVRPIIAALTLATPDLDKLNIPYDASPAFLLDGDRRIGTGLTPSPGMFDNRSVSLVTDFPSANRMLAEGIRRIVLVQMSGTTPQEDLAHTLLRWQEAGIVIESAKLDPPTSAIPIEVIKPPMYRQLWQRLLATMGLRKSPLGGFGGVLPIPSESGGAFG